MGECFVLLVRLGLIGLVIALWVNQPFLLKINTPTLWVNFKCEEMSGRWSFVLVSQMFLFQDRIELYIYIACLS